MRSLNDEILDVLVQFLNRREILSVRRSGKFVFFDAYAAALKIYKFWYVKKTQQWINDVIRQSLRRNRSPHRLALNLHCKYIPCQEKHIGNLPQQIIVLDDYLTCPKCNWYDVDAAVYFSLGPFFPQDPYVEFFCRYCAEEECYQLFDYYDEPMICLYNSKTFHVIL